MHRLENASVRAASTSPSSTSFSGSPSTDCTGGASTSKRSRLDSDTMCLTTSVQKNETFRWNSVEHGQERGNPRGINSTSSEHNDLWASARKSAGVSLVESGSSLASEQLRQPTSTPTEDADADDGVRSIPPQTNPPGLSNSQRTASRSLPIGNDVENPLDCGSHQVSDKNCSHNSPKPKPKPASKPIVIATLPPKRTAGVTGAMADKPIAPLAGKSIPAAVAAIFNEDSDSEPEEMPLEARMRMRNLGKDTPTACGPRSYNKSKRGFVDRRYERSQK